MQRITWTPDEGSGGTVVLASPTPGRGPGSKLCVSSTPLHERLIETVAYPRAEYVDHFDRGNRRTGYTFSVMYEFSSYSECGRFLNRLGNSLAGKGTLAIVYPDGGTDTLEDAVWQNIPQTQNLGASALVTFTFFGSRFIGPPDSGTASTTNI